MYKLFAKYGLLAMFSTFGLLLPLFVAWAEPMYPWQTPDRNYDALMKRVAELEDRLADTCRLSDACKKNIIQQVEELTKYRSAELDIREKGFDKRFENSLSGLELRMNQAFALLFGFGGIAGYFGIRNEINKAREKIKAEAEIKIQEEINKHIKEGMDVLRDLIRNRELEKELKGQPIILLGKTKEECGDMEKLLFKLGFTGVRSEAEDKFALKENCSEFVLFDKTVDFRIIEDKYLGNTPDNKIFLQYYPDGQQRFAKDANRPRINFANSHITLYARVMESLIYRDIISKTSS